MYIQKYVYKNDKLVYGEQSKEILFTFQVIANLRWLREKAYVKFMFKLWNNKAILKIKLYMKGYEVFV